MTQQKHITPLSSGEGFGGGDWDATAFFQRLTSANKFAQAHSFTFAKVSGIDGFEEALQQLQDRKSVV